MKELIQAFKDSVAQSGLQLDMTPQYVILCLLVSLACAAVIALVYKFFYRGPCYSANFNILLVMTTEVTTFALMTVSANLVLSLGMVGALSIVRFRAAVKDPLDVGFLFWTVAAGITCGAGLFVYSLICTCFIAALYIVLALIKSGPSSYLLIVRCSDAAQDKVDAAIRESCRRPRVKNLLRATGSVELTVQLSLRKGGEALTSRLSKLEGVTSAMLVEYTGDI